MNKSVVVGLTVSSLTTIMVLANAGLLQMAYSTSLGDDIREEVNKKVESSRDGHRDDARDTDDEAKEEQDEIRDRDNDDDDDGGHDNDVGDGVGEGSGMQIFTDIRGTIERFDGDDENVDQPIFRIPGVIKIWSPHSDRGLICNYDEIPCDP